MTTEFLKHIYRKHQDTPAVPPTNEISEWALKIIRLLYPEKTKDFFRSINEIEGEFWNLGNELKTILNATDECRDCDNKLRSKDFIESIPALYKTLNTDVDAIMEGDPAAKNEFEVIRAYPGFYAISIYRLANKLLKLDIPLIPRILTEFAHSQTGIDIHPGAEIAESFFIDHGTGIVIGETSHIGKHVKLYQGVTLGALSVEKKMANVKRHPTVKDHVVIYSGATILGGETIIGEHSIIGGNVWVTKSVPPHSTVYHRPEIEVVQQSDFK